MNFLLAGTSKHLQLQLVGKAEFSMLPSFASTIPPFGATCSRPRAVRDLLQEPPTRVW